VRPRPLVSPITGERDSYTGATVSHYALRVTNARGSVV
jgi:hypothetical protein